MKKVLPATVLLMALLSFPGCAMKSELTVGKDIKPADITEFYYTYDASTNPPRYQRYRFYTEDGDYYFYHEKREGDHWPLTETDATVTGTISLTEEEWKTFFALLEGGTVTKRSVSTESGDPGPWLYLYWKKDRSEYQGYTFASTEAKLSFEDFCAGLKDR